MKRIISVLFIISLTKTSAMAAVTLYGINSSYYPSSVWTIDQTTVTASKVVNISDHHDCLNYGGAAFLNGKLYVSNMYLDNLYNNILGTVDLATGAFSYVFDQNLSNWYGLAANQSAGLLYYISNGSLYSYNPVAGINEHIGNNIINDGLGMCYNDNFGILYATNGGSLYTVDTASGAAIYVGSVPFSSYQAVGLAYDEIDNVIWAVCGDYHGGSNLYKITPTTAAYQYMGKIDVDYMGALTWIPAPGAILLAGLGTGLVSYLRRKRII